MLSLAIPTCGKFRQCSRIVGISAPNHLALEDRDGRDMFTITQREYNSILEIAALPEFQRAMADPDAWSCPEKRDAEAASAATLSVRWRDGTSQIATVVDDCFASPDEPLGIYSALRERLVELKKKYLDCPIILGVPMDLDPVHDPTPERPLCFACLGQC